MSVDNPVEPEDFSNVTGTSRETFPEPRAHGAGVMNHFADFDPRNRRKPAGERGTLYARALSYWREHVENPENEPYVAVDDFDADWLPEGDYALVLTSSRWKAGKGLGDDYRSFYDQHLKLRRWGPEDDNGERPLQKPPLALHVEINPQYQDMVYKSGDPLECPHGEGTRVVGWTTWAEGPEEIEHRMYDALRAVYGDDCIDLEQRVFESRRISKAEAHIRFNLEKKGAVIETIDQSKHLIDWGGESEIDARQRRLKEGWLEAIVESDRWNLLGFDPQRYSTELKVYQIGDWHKRPRSDAFAHPKLEASFSGVDRGELPHVLDWDDVLHHLRTVVATHAQWAGVRRSDLVSDDFFDGPMAAPFTFERPTGRRQMLRRRYEDLATEIYREALKESTTSVYDILRVIAEETGASYDCLQERTGLARSTVRYHVARLAEAGVVKRLGNPVLVVFVSQAVLERAREIVREIRPDDMAEDMNERRDERRERREELQEEMDDQSNERDDEASESATSDDQIGFEYLAKLSASFAEIAQEYDRDRLDDRDIRVRADELPPPLR
ncbi:winged helix-turn-helix domain-containing protein [Natronosalvus halobius]|uniref:winged helix-turn-helix domain-containing protein n=1 Tax=Natronosalvus halobius TaxID=2953746 RepID=UPI00209D8911|nr:winged helix-turn-helix domain-containing protein [Natronosalvus halobius]USZ72000.1 winged helix-turn-helix domain-containing protein [Natronosalvus halobius]